MSIDTDKSNKKIANFSAKKRKLSKFVDNIPIKQTPKKSAPKKIIIKQLEKQIKASEKDKVMLKSLETLQTMISEKLKQPQHKNNKILHKKYDDIAKRLNSLKQRHQKNIATIKQNYTKISQGFSKIKS